MNSYRIFISYSHEDREIVKIIVKILEENGLTPLWDENFAFGHGFPEQIKNFIAHSHIFIPIITEASSKRGWVHQEIGYAMALNIPILPITLGQIPGEMLQDLIAVSWTDDLRKLKIQLSRKTFDNLVHKAQEKSLPLFECAEFHEDRTMMMANYAKRVLEIGFYGHVRQKGALSSFHIPDKPNSHPVWKQRYGSYKVSEYRSRLLREERIALENHAKESGCSLIINPYLSYDKYGNKARKVRLETLLEFLEKESIPKEKVKVAISKNIPTEKHLTIVGDWFMAESISGFLGKGYQQTIFTRHAPTIQKRIELFDQELENLLNNKKIPPESSLEIAIAEIKKILEKS